MGDQNEANNPCACLFNSQYMVQRLLSILRQSQAYCTDNDCLNAPTLPRPEAPLNPNDFMMLCMMVIIGLIMIAFRPQSLRYSNKTTKTRDNQPGSDDEPPLPPPAIN